jgi:hypothetical protein
MWASKRTYEICVSECYIMGVIWRHVMYFSYGHITYLFRMVTSHVQYKYILHVLITDIQYVSDCNVVGLKWLIRWCVKQPIYSHA